MPDRTTKTINLNHLPSGVRLAIAYMEEQYSEPITLSDIARAAHLNKEHFSRAFKAATSYPPRRYLMRLRAERAHEAIEDDPHQSLLGVGLDVGYTSLRQLERAFRCRYRTTPTKWRDRARAKAKKSI